LPKKRKSKPLVYYTVHYRYHKKSICGCKKPYADTHLLSVVTCKRCKRVIRGMLSEKYGGGKF